MPLGVIPYGVHHGGLLQVSTRALRLRRMHPLLRAAARSRRAGCSSSAWCSGATVCLIAAYPAACRGTGACPAACRGAGACPACRGAGAGPVACPAACILVTCRGAGVCPAACLITACRGSGSGAGHAVCLRVACRGAPGGRVPGVHHVLRQFDGVVGKQPSFVERFRAVLLRRAHMARGGNHGVFSRCTADLPLLGFLIS